MGEGAGRALPRCLETGLARNTCAPGVRFQERLVRLVPSEPENYGGLPGLPKPCQSLDAPSEEALAGGLREAAAPPG